MRHPRIRAGGGTQHSTLNNLEAVQYDTGERKGICDAPSKKLHIAVLRRQNRNRCRLYRTVSGTTTFLLYNLEFNAVIYSAIDRIPKYSTYSLTMRAPHAAYHENSARYSFSRLHHDAVWNAHLTSCLHQSDVAAPTACPS